MSTRFLGALVFVGELAFFALLEQYHLYDFLILQVGGFCSWNF